MLHQAVRCTGPAVPKLVQLLIDARADVFARDAARKTPAGHLPALARKVTPEQLAAGRLIIAEGKRRGVDPGYPVATASAAYVSGGCSTSSGGCSGGCGGCGGCGS